MARRVDLRRCGFNGWGRRMIINVPTSDSTLALKRKAEEARVKRDAILSTTDWSGNSDVTMSQEMANYRQALRDVPDQEGFPSTINWPTLEVT
jgi:hypothetical protein